jgi:hypothetical protein
MARIAAVASKGPGMNLLYKHLMSLKEADHTICIHDIRFTGGEHTSETRHIVLDFDEHWLCVKNIQGGGDSFHFMSIHSISSCSVTDYSRRKTSRD